MNNYQFKVHDSRITAGPIESIISLDKVERLGYFQMNLSREPAILKKPGTVQLIGEDGRQWVWKINRSATPLIKVVADELRNKDLYLSNMVIGSWLHFDESVLGDLYSSKRV